MTAAVGGLCCRFSFQQQVIRGSLRRSESDRLIGHRARRVYACFGEKEYCENDARLDVQILQNLFHLREFYSFA